MASHCFLLLGLSVRWTVRQQKIQICVGRSVNHLRVGFTSPFVVSRSYDFWKPACFQFHQLLYDRDFRDFWVGTLLFSPRPKPNPDTQCMVHLPIHLPYKWPTVGKYTSPIECLGKLTSTKNNGLIWYCIPIDFERFFEGHHRFLLAKSIAGLSKKYLCPEYVGIKLIVYWHVLLIFDDLG